MDRLKAREAVWKWLMTPERLYGDRGELIRTLDEAMVAGGGGIRAS